MSRTILLIQPDDRVEKRTYSRFQSIDDCMERVCKTYEGGSDIDMLKVLTCLVYQRDTNDYVTRNKDWIKDQIHTKLLRTSITSKVLKKKLAKNVRKYWEENPQDDRSPHSMDKVYRVHRGKKSGIRSGTINRI